MCPGLRQVAPMSVYACLGSDAAAIRDAFLTRLHTPEVKALYADLDERWATRASAVNQALADAGAPLQVRALSSIWTVVYTQPSRYHWMLQYYLREAGLALSWVGTGRFIFSLAYTDADMAEVTRRLVSACQRMQADGWWWVGEYTSHKSIQRKILKEMVRSRFI